MKIFDKIKEQLKPLFDPAPKETVEHHASEAVEQARKHLPENIKAMSKEQLAFEINNLRQPNKWFLTRRCAQGLQKTSHGGNTYQPGYTSDNKLARIKRQIEKGMIQDNTAQIEERFRLRQERIAKQLAKKQEAT